MLSLYLNLAFLTVETLGWYPNLVFLLGDNTWVPTWSVMNGRHLALIDFAIAIGSLVVKYNGV